MENPKGVLQKLLSDLCWFTGSWFTGFSKLVSGQNVQGVGNKSQGRQNSHKPQVLGISGHMWSVATTLDSVDKEHFHYHSFTGWHCFIGGVGKRFQ